MVGNVRMHWGYSWSLGEIKKLIKSGKIGQAISEHNAKFGEQEAYDVRIHSSGTITVGGTTLAMLDAMGQP